MSIDPESQNKSKVIVSHETSHEEHLEDAEAWLISYADMMTLLMAFFAIMFSFSRVDQKKFDALAHSVSTQFGGKVQMPFDDLTRTIEDLIKKKHLENKVSVEQDRSRMAIVFQGSTLFGAGEASLTPESKDTVSDFLDILREKAITYPVVVEGHTDDTPISTPAFPSNWELSGARASLILRMLESKGFTRTNLRAEGFADIEPVAPDENPDGTPNMENKSKNRRVTIRVLKELPPQ